MSRSSTRTWAVGAVVAAALLVLAGWYLLISPVRAEAAEHRQATVDAEAANQQLEDQLDLLQEQYAELPEQQARLAALRQQLPEAAQLPALLRELQGAADASGVTLQSVTPGTPALAGVDASTGASTGTAAPDLVEVPLTIETTGGFAGTAEFMRLVQTGMQRVVLVSGVDAAALEEGGEGADDAVEQLPPGTVTTTLTASAFVLPDTEPATATP